MPKSYKYDWEALIEEQQASGMNMKKFCMKNELPYQSFKNHKYATQAKSSDVLTFVAVKEEPVQEVEFKINGNVISFDMSIDDRSVARILKALVS